MQDVPPPSAVSLPRRTARLILRPYQPGDLAALHDMFSREDVCRYLPWAPMDLGQARAKLEQRIRQTRLAADGDAIVLAVAEVATGRMVGELMLRLVSTSSRQGEIGWSFHPDVHGRGLATEGAREIIRMGFEELGLHRIWAGCDARNDASLRVMGRLGMRREAALVENEYLKGEWTSEVICALLATEWRAAGG